MTISIGGIGPHSTTEFNESPVDRVTSSLTNKAREGVDAPLTRETTTLVASAANVAVLTSAAVSMNGVRTDRVEQLRHSIASGTYKVEPNLVADAIVRDWQRKVGSKRH
jgi:flagellar biosynthesis anti-sigma factor FlgM